MRCSITLLSVLSISLLTACDPPLPSGASRVIQPHPTETYTHAHSQFRFPPKIGGFDRAAVRQHDRDGLDVGIGYNHLGHGVGMTIFVYPIPQEAPDDTLAGHFGTCKAEVLRRHSGAQLVSEGAVQVSPGGQKRDGQRATFSFTDLFAQQRLPVRSELYLLTKDRWYIKYRATYPMGQLAVAESAIRSFIDDLTWPYECRHAAPCGRRR